VVVGPTCLVPPRLLTEADDVRRVGGLTRPYNLLDWPAISVPVRGAPGIGVQIAAPRSRTAEAIQVALVLESILEDAL
jgi:Asp-tRNA(Asn)/Glu-tRNA(Gln) amidotransferase A subunit family amidase